MICNRSTPLKLEKHIFITINMTTRRQRRPRKQNQQMRHWGGGLTARAPDHMTQSRA
jgi:hypothetical protein